MSMHLPNPAPVAASDVDEYTGDALPPELVAAAKEEEVSAMEEWAVWEEVDEAECRRVTGKRPIKGRWVVTNKGDRTTPDIRARWVAKEVNTYKTDAFYSSTPPLEAMRLLLSEAATTQADGAAMGSMKLLLLDAKKAHLHAPAVRQVYVDLPPERQRPGRCCRLLRCLYGTRDAPQQWERYAANCLEHLGFVRGSASATVFRHRSRRLLGMVHGDDFLFAGADADLDWISKELQKSILMKVGGRLGDGPADVRELRCLNRILRWTPSGFELEADPRHGEILQAMLGSAPRAVGTPGVKEKLSPFRSARTLDTAEADKDYEDRVSVRATKVADLQAQVRDLSRRLAAKDAQVSALCSLDTALLDYEASLLAAMRRDAAQPVAEADRPCGEAALVSHEARLPKAATAVEPQAAAADRRAALQRVEGYVRRLRLGPSTRDEVRGISSTFGLATAGRGSLAPSIKEKTRRQAPLLRELWDALRALPDWPPDFPVTSLQIAHNTEVDEHRDRGNLGPSLVLSFGDYVGGTFYANGLPYDVHDRVLRFDGRELHSVGPYVGERFSVVAYCHSCVLRADPELLAELREMGFSPPSAATGSAAPSSPASSSRRVRFSHSEVREFVVPVPPGTVWRPVVRRRHAVLEAFWRDCPDKDLLPCGPPALPNLLRLSAAASSSSPSLAPILRREEEEEEEESADQDPLLTDEEAGWFRGAAARANYLAMDRVDLAFAAKELCRKMSVPRRSDLKALQRLAKYILGSPRMVQRYRWQAPRDLEVFADTDFAGCVRTRRSTSGGICMRGSHLIKHWSKTQKVVTLSSAEAELGGVVLAATEGLGTQSVATDLGIHLRLRLRADSAAAIGICNRSGIGKVRHLAVSQLWVQERIRSGALLLAKVRGDLNPADACTKYLAAPVLHRCMAMAGAYIAEGRSAASPELAADIVPFLQETKGPQKSRAPAEQQKRHKEEEEEEASYDE